MLTELTEMIQRSQDAEVRFALLDMTLVELSGGEHGQHGLAEIQAELLRLRS